MGRIARQDILYDGCYAHVFSRSIEKRRIFQKDQDFQSFRELLIQAKKEYHFQVFHYCLMNTHFHLAVKMKSVESFSQGLQLVKWNYTRTYNKKYKRRGPLWQERFRSLLIEDERYLYACGLYIEANPVKAGMVRESSQWKYSSDRCYNKMISDELVDKYKITPSVPEDVEINNEQEFDRGRGVGSEWFKYCLRRKVPWVSPKR